jgi:adenylylsulfate kinase
VSWIVWLTGPPAAGKTTIAAALRESLGRSGIASAWLESDALRRILTPEPTYSPEERDRFYAVVADLAALLARQGIPVIVDATAPRRAHRDRLRAQVPDLLEVLVDAPLEVRRSRDPKGLYRRAREGLAPELPGETSPYEAPAGPALVLSGIEPPADNAAALRRLLAERNLVPREPEARPGQCP